MMKLLKTYKLYRLLIICFFLFPASAFSQTAQVPYHIQAALFKKIFTHIDPLKNTEKKSVLIVYDSSTEIEAAQMQEEMRKLDLDAKLTQPVQLVMNIHDYEVVYFMPGLEKYAELCRQYKKLSISGKPEHAKNGNISIALGIERDKPRIYVNIGLLSSEGKDIGVELLQISKAY